MSHTQVPKNPTVVLFANNVIGLEIARYLKKRKEHIAALVIHPPEKAILADQIRAEIKPAYCFDAGHLYNPHVLKTIRSLKPDMAICAWFGYILKKEIIELFPSGVINTHNSYLPYNRGKYPQSWAIAKGTPYGVTLHYIDERIDTGEIVAQTHIPVNIVDTGESLYNKSVKEIITLFKKTWPAIKSNTINPKKQHSGRASYHAAKDIAVLDEIHPYKKYKAIDLINQIRSRSFNKKTYAFFIHKGEKIYIRVELHK